MMKISFVVLSVLCLGNPISAFLSSSPLHFQNGKSAAICKLQVLGNSDSAVKREPTSLRMAAGGPVATDNSFLNHPLASLLAECKDFGLVRFISVNPSGSVLETAGAYNAKKQAFAHRFRMPGWTTTRRTRFHTASAYILYFFKSERIMISRCASVILPDG
jgi:hypothetical protein